MANPTNVSVPPPLAAVPTNVSVPIGGTKFPSGLTGADSVVVLGQGSDIGDTSGVDQIVDSWIAPFDGYFRSGNYQNFSITSTGRVTIKNATTVADVAGATTLTSNTASAVAFATLGFSKGDQIDLTAQTNGGGESCKGVAVHLMYTPLSGSATSPF